MNIPCPDPAAESDLATTAASTVSHQAPAGPGRAVDPVASTLGDPPDDVDDEYEPV